MADDITVAFEFLIAGRESFSRMTKRSNRVLQWKPEDFSRQSFGIVRCFGRRKPGVLLYMAKGRLFRSESVAVRHRHSSVYFHQTREPSLDPLILRISVTTVSDLLSEHENKRSILRKKRFPSQCNSKIEPKSDVFCLKKREKDLNNGRKHQ